MEEGRERREGRREGGRGGRKGGRVGGWEGGREGEKQGGREEERKRRKQGERGGRKAICIVLPHDGRQKEWTLKWLNHSSLHSPEDRHKAIPFPPPLPTYPQPTAHGGVYTITGIHFNQRQ